MGYVVAAWLAAGVLLAGYGWSIHRRRRAVAAEAGAEAAAQAAASGREDGAGAP